MKMYKRHELPLFGRLNIKFDVQKVINYLEDKDLLNFQRYNELSPGTPFFDTMISYRPVWRGRFLTEEEKKNYHVRQDGDFYKQLALTDLNPKYMAMKSSINVEERSRDSAFMRLKRIDPKREIYQPYADEKNYDLRRDFVRGPLAELIDSFKGQVARPRFALLRPGFKIDPHIDHNTDYCLRVHIPLITNEKCKLGVFRKDGSLAEKHLEPDGSVWFFNSGFKHYAENMGSSDRLHLLVNLYSPEDIPDYFFDRSDPRVIW
jgi:hypothetical protein